MTLRSPEHVAREAFRRMVTAFEGAYHPDTPPTTYVKAVKGEFKPWLPHDYTVQRVEEVEEFARACGLDLYAEALAVTQETLS
jgi:hypothetical protein